MQPLRIYGSEISYFTGKFETYLRYKEIPYQRISRPPMRLPELKGVAQMPVAELADGRWMTDTTPMIEWLETQWPEPAVIPRDPLQAFFSRLLEDYADKWLATRHALPLELCGRPEPAASQARRRVDGTRSAAGLLEAPVHVHASTHHLHARRRRDPVDLEPHRGHLPG